MFVQKLYEHQKRTTEAGMKFDEEGVYPSNLGKNECAASSSPQDSVALEHLQQNSNSDAQDIKEASSNICF